MNDSQYEVKALNDLRGNALLLLMANEYICEEKFLIKIGGEIDKSVQKLKEDISLLKKEFPGKFASEVETDDIMEKISNTAQSMLRPGIEIQESCVLGKLGGELESDVKSIANAVNLIKAQVKGSDLTYSRKDSISNTFDSLKESIGGKIILGLKILCGIILIAIVAFIYLFVTMEREGALLKEIAESQTRIKTQQELLSQLDTKKEKISKELKSLDKTNLFREDKIAIMDLEVEIHNINEDRHKIEAEIAAHEKKISDNQKRVEEIKKVPFIKRLLRK